MPNLSCLKVPAIIVHERAHGEAALAVAEELGVTVTLWSAPGAAAYLGAAYFQAMIAQASRGHPGVEILAVLDCGERAGDVMGALRQGIEAVCFSGPREVALKLRGIASQQDATLFTTRPEALDLAGVRDVASACRSWLKS